jgi:cytochrome P450 family 135
MGMSTSTPLPRSPSEPPIVQTLWWLSRPISFMESCRRRHGDAFSVRFVGFERPTVFLSDPAVVRALYTEQAHGLPPGRVVALRPVLGPDSLLLLQGREHIARRRLMLPPFHGERMRSYESIVREVAQREIASWPEGRTFALHPRMQAITLEVILRAVFGVVDEGRRELLRARLPRLLGESSSIWLQLRVLLSRRASSRDPMERLQQVIGEIDELLLAEIAERREDPRLARREDILSLLIAARFEDGSQMGDRELRDQLLTLLLAGHETTATALAWTLDLLLRHPSALRRLTAEIDSGTGEDYMRACVTEALRLRPVVPLAGRRLTVDLETDGLKLPAGTDVTPAIWLTHTRPDLYPRPYEFEPERFLDQQPPTYGWIPFGGGVRRCLGAAFAEFEMRIVLQSILRDCTLRAAGRRPERVARRNVTFSPKRGTRVRVEHRHPGRLPARPRSAPAAAR